MEPLEIQASLRNEIVESQKTQAEFLKWKLIAVAAVSSISLGFNGKARGNPVVQQLLLCSIPLICAYVDFISLHVMIRIVTIGTYLQKIGSEYEAFVFLTRERGANPFFFETLALHGSSLVFDSVLIAFSFAAPSDWPRKAYVFSGSLGLFVTVIAWMLYTFRARRVRDLALKP